MTDKDDIAGNLFVWRLRRIVGRVKCFLTGGHVFSRHEWQYDCKGHVQYVCKKCYTAIKDVPLEDFEHKDFLMGESDDR